MSKHVEPRTQPPDKTLRRFAPPPEALLNHVINRIPFVAWRLAAYRAFGVRMANRSSGTIMLGTEIWAPRSLSLGRRVVVGRSCLLDARGGIEIGDDANVSSYSRLITAKHLLDEPEFPDAYAPIVVGRRAWIATGATILGGVVIGEGAVVAANATVTRDVPPFTIVGGTPATVIGKRSERQTYELDYRPNWL